MAEGERDGPSASPAAPRSAPPELPLDIREVEAAEDVAACLALRWQAFVVEQGVPEAEELDGLDGAGRHVLARVGGEPAGAARVRRVGAALKIQRVCVAQAFRGRGLGAALVRFCVGLAREEDAEAATLSAQVEAMGLYRRLGFEALGEVYDDAGIPHRDMALRLR